MFDVFGGLNIVFWSYGSTANQGATYIWVPVQDLAASITVLLLPKTSGNAA